MEKNLADAPDTLTPRRVSRLRAWRELAIFASIIMEISWAVLWYRALINSSEVLSYGRVFVVFGGILFFSHSITRVTNHLIMNMMIRRVIIVGVILVSVLVSFELLLDPHETLSMGELLHQQILNFRDMGSLIPPGFVLILIVLFVCWRGMSLIGKQVAPDYVISEFRKGIVLLLIYGVFFAFTGDTPIFTVYIFIFFSLIAMSAARISILGAIRGGRRIPFSRQWFLGILITVMVIVGISAFVVSLLKDRGFEFIFELYAWFIQLLILMITPLMWLITLIFSLIWEWLNIEMMVQMFVEAMNRLQIFVVELLDAINFWFGRMDAYDLRQFFFSIGTAKPYILWGAIILFVLLLLMTIRRHLWTDQEDDDQEYQSLLDQEDMLGLLRSALSRGLARVADGLEQIMRLRHTRRMLAAARIRRIYAHLMDLSAKLDQPRPSSKTPLEFLPNLEGIFPTLLIELETITNAYLRVRYGELPETHQEVAEVESAWKRVRSLGKVRLRANRHYHKDVKDLMK